MEATGNGGQQHQGERSIGLGLFYLACGLTIAALGFALLAAVLFFSIEILFAATDRNDVGLAMVFLFVFGPLGIALLSIGSNQARLGALCFRPGGAGLKLLDPRLYAMQTGEYTYTSFLGLASPLVTAALAFAFLVLLALPVAAILANKSDDWILELAIATTLFATLAGGFAYLWFHGRKFGRSTCRMRGKHPRIGGMLVADVEVACTGMRTALPRLPDTDVSVKLQIVSVKGGVLWEKAAAVARDAITRPGDGTLHIPVSLAIPADVLEHDGVVGSWRLRLHARYPGVDYASMFWPIMVMAAKDPAKPAGT